ncbi:hypothetical protein [Pseudonocardia sp. KRD291]|uniref:hypothetical protein n=1 Tax=Pseudonocardia sp. KRD291 TaxID=2792007 RepID=UPI001C5C677D|nr:hypothetical protein [Pseudonocardia sp. KRD291]MBW0102227.1 hypothetical protein [Pseudonocardia sp. KRD291]
MRVRALESTASSLACERFLSEVWRTDPACPPIAADVIRAIADAGSYVTGAVDEATTGDRLLGACIGLWGPPGRPVMHSHLAGVHAAARGRDVGFVLKLDQRAHALEHGVGEITWTFDPLVARNAHFNLRKLGGTADEYLTNHYGRLSDGLNGADDSDRLLLRWDLLGGQVRAACDDGDRRAPLDPAPPALLATDGDRPRPRPVRDRTVLVPVPRDIEDLRAREPTAAREWRLAVRDVLGGLLTDGARLVDFDRTACGYVVTREGSR